MPEAINNFRRAHGFLSNFYPCKVKYANRTYSSVEHAYQAAKTLNDKDRLRISKCATPAMAKRIGRAVVLRKNWDRIKTKVMKKLLIRKFKHEDLKKRLLLTGDAELIEGNWWGDIWWGVDLDTGKGENWLGRLLMEVRTELEDDK